MLSFVRVSMLIEVKSSYFFSVSRVSALFSSLAPGQWPEASGLVARCANKKTHGHARESHANRVRFSRTAVDFFTRETCKVYETNLIPRATAYWLLHEVAPRSYAGSRDLSFFIPRPPNLPILSPSAAAWMSPGIPMSRPSPRPAGESEPEPSGRVLRGRARWTSAAPRRPRSLILARPPACPCVYSTHHKRD